MASQPASPAGAPPPNLLANPLEAGNIIITGGVYGSGLERIILHAGGPPSAPPATAAGPTLSPVFIVPSSLAQQQTSSQYMHNMMVSTTPSASKLPATKLSPIFDDRGNNGLRSPLIDNSDKVSRTPIPVIGAQDNDVGLGICGWLLTAFSWVIVIVTLPFSLCVCFKVVQEYERAVIFRLGRLLEGGSKGPGLHFSLPCVESHEVVDMRTITLSVPPQEVLTKDSVTVSVDAVVYYRVSNATVSVANVENAHHSTRLLAQTTLRNILGTKSLHEILSDRESISNSMQNALDEATEPWGIKVERVEIKDARLPEQLQRAMAAEAEASREARAKVIAADGEKRASRALREASSVIDESPSALQLRYLQTLSSIAAEKNSTIIFPIPIDFISHFVKPPSSPSLVSPKKAK